jgi:glucose/arabinose dehydrogenase
MPFEIRRSVRASVTVFAITFVATLLPVPGWAQPTVVDKRLAVRTAASGLSQPVAMAFLGDDDFLVIEKASGRVKRVTNGAVVATALDLAVNSASERGLLGIALHPAFPTTPWVYLYWTESSTGADTTALANVPLLGNRVDRFTWNASTSTLSFDRNIVRLHAFQADAGQPLRGNHNGGVLRFGQDGKLFVVIGDNGRRGQMQNLEDGPFGPGIPDDQLAARRPTTRT